eukprot:TRINITY_DN6125_c0_g1_i2.p2 TRINITY_DN6125_c0_g1~~TRINITY_DN6125_c0_g1_i2.p2  ORF type:complete len:235 (-),score=33.37 TRINITY_DN6125_c0_g1_i2:39-743(-)
MPLLECRKPPTNAEIEESEGIYLTDGTRFGPPAVVLPFLILGSSGDARDHKLMDELGVGWVLNVATEVGCMYKHDDVKYLKVEIQDMLPTTEDQYHLFEESFAFINEAKKAYEAKMRGEEVGRHACFVHCMRGRSRSATIILSYLMSWERISLAEAYLNVKAKRIAIGPHAHLKRQLVRYETHLTGKNTLPYAKWRSLEASADYSFDLLEAHVKAILEESQKPNTETTDLKEEV